MKLPKRPTIKVLLIILLIITVSLVVGAWFKFETALSPTVIPTNKIKTTEKLPNEKTEIQKPVMSTFDNSKFSTSEPSSIWVVVNKQHPLTPVSFIPSNLITTVGATISSKAKPDFDAMNTAALSEGVNFTIISSYRSYASQNKIYNNYIASYGQASTDTFSARPGFSEHQTGLAIDFGSSTNANCNLDGCFGTSIEGQWLAKHAFEYGFLLRYTIEKQKITGYKAEPWHFRFIGKELANEMKIKSIITLEEFFNISGGETYVQ